MKLNNRVARIAMAVAAAFTIALALAAPDVRGESLESRVIAMFPKDVGEIAYADLSQVRNFSWYAQFKQQVLPPRFMEFAEFLKAAGIDPETQIDGVAWAVASKAANQGERNQTERPADDVVCVATGQFHPDITQGFFDAHKIEAVKYLDNKMYPAAAASGGDVFMMFLDSSTIAFGPRRLLERLIRVRGDDEENLAENETLIPLINQANGSGIFWGVLNTTGALQVIQQFVPATGGFTQASRIIDKIGAVIISVRGSDRMEANIAAVTGSTHDAAVLSQLLFAGLMVRQYETTESNPEMAHILAGVDISANGNQLNISFSMTEDQLIALVKHGSFGMKL